jgi:uncharacterized protein HemX
MTSDRELEILGLKVLLREQQAKLDELNGQLSATDARISELQASAAPIEEERDRLLILIADTLMALARLDASVKRKIRLFSPRAEQAAPAEDVA